MPENKINKIPNNSYLTHKYYQKCFFFFFLSGTEKKPVVASTLPY